MNETETNSPAPGELAEQVLALQRQVFTLLLALIVVSGTLTVYLYRQASVTRKDINAIRPQAEKIISVFNQNRAGIAGVRRPTCHLRPDASRFPAGFEEIRHCAAASHQDAGQARARRARCAKEVKNLRHLHAAVRTKIRLRRNFFPQPAQSNCAALLRR